MSRHVLWLLVALHVTIALSDVNTEGHVVSCVAHITRRYFKQGILIVFIPREKSPATDVRVLKQLHHQMSWRIALLSSQEEKWTATHLDHSEKAMGYIIFTEVGDISHVLNIAHRQSHWNPRAQFLVITSGELQSSHILARDILAALWDKQVIQATVLVAPAPESQASHSLQLFTWYPFYSPGNCGHQVKTATLVDTWTGGRFLQDNNLFPDKVPDNLQGCPLHVAAFNAPPFVLHIPAKKGQQSNSDGLELRLLQTLSHLYNFTIIFDQMKDNNTTHGVQFHNKTWFKDFGHVMERVDISLGSLLPTPELFAISDLTTGYFSNGVVWVVPKAKTVPPWRSIYSIFSPSTWFLLIIAFVCTAFVLWLLAVQVQESNAEPVQYRSLISSFMTMISMHLGISVNQPRSTMLRMFFLLVACYSLWVDTALQSMLVTSLSVPRMLAQISTQEALLHSHLKLGAASDLHHLFDADSQIAQRINTHCGDDNLQCLKRVGEGDFAFVADKALLQFLKKGHGRTPFKMFKTNVFSYIFGMVLPKGSMYIDNFNKAIHRINQACLMDKWRTDLASNFASWSVKPSTSNAKKIKRSTNGPQQFNINHLHAPFFSLVVRLAFAFVVFLIELGVEYFKRRQQIHVLPFVL